MKKARNKLTAVISLVLSIFICFPTVVFADSPSKSVSENFDALLAYIDTNGEVDEDNNKYLPDTMTNSTGVYFFGITDYNGDLVYDYIQSTIVDEESETVAVIMLEFFLQRNNPDVTFDFVYSIVVGEDVIEYVEDTVTVNRTAFTNKYDYVLNASGVYTTSEEFSELFNACMPNAMGSLDDMMSSKLRFGFKGLGFMAYPGRGYVACDDCLGIHTVQPNLLRQKEATCTEEGYTGDLYCLNCNKIISTGTKIEPFGHTYSNTCDATCNRCGLLRSVPDHVYCSDCDQICDVCGNIRTDAAAHKYQDGVCTVCGMKEEKVIGDVTLDFKVDNSDLIRLKKYFAGQEVSLMRDLADVTGDGKCDNADLIRLKKYLAGQSVVLGK